MHNIFIINLAKYQQQALRSSPIEQCQFQSFKYVLAYLNNNVGLETNQRLGSFGSLGLVFLSEIVHDFVDGLLDVVDPFAHLIDAADDVGGHLLESALHLLEHVLHEFVQLFGGGVFALLLHLLRCLNYMVNKD